MLELGGSDPFVVLADADVTLAAATAVKARFSNTGQSCVCAKRFIVHEDVADEFVERFVDNMALLEIAPMAREDLRDGIVRQVDESVAQGARLVIGGRAIDGPGWYVEPTLLTDVEPGMTAFDEETFGPVATITRARDDDHAVELANDTTFGLGASVWGDVRPRPGRRSPDPLRRALRQRDGRLRPATALRRHRPQRLRPRALGRRRPRVHQRPHHGGGLMRLDHVGLNVADLASMTAWYGAALKLDVEFEFALDHVDFSGVMLRSPDGYRLELLCRTGNGPGLQAANPVEAALTRGFGHVAFDVPDVDPAYDALLAAGATDRMSPRPSPEPGVRMAYVADPEGNLIELLDRSTS